MHPSFIGTPVGVWFLDGEPVRLVACGRRLRVVGEPVEFELGGEAHWRLRARLESGGVEFVDIKRDGAGWVLVALHGETAGAREESASARRR